MAQEAEPLLTAEELSAHLNLPGVRSVYRLLARRAIPCIRIGHRTVRFRLSQVNQALAKREQREAGASR